MGSFLDYGSVPEGEVGAPVPINTDPRGRTADGFLSLLNEQRERKQAEAEQRESFAEENGFGLTHYLGESIKQESITNSLFGLAQDYVQDFDPKFDPTPFVTEDMPDWRKRAVMEAKNEKHAHILVERTRAQELYELEGQYHGGMGVAMQLVGGVASPETLLLGFGEVAALTKLGLSGGKAIKTGMAIGGLSNAAQEAAIVANNKSRDKLGIALAAGFGAGFGALGGLVTPKALDEIAEVDNLIGKEISRAWEKDLALATGDIKVSNKITPSPDAQVWQDAAMAGEAAIDENGLYVIKAGDNLLTYGSKAEAVAARRLHAKDAPVDEEAVAKQMELDYEAEAKLYDEQIPRRKGIGRFASIGLEGRSSKNPFIRKVYTMLTEDASGTGGKNVTSHSGALIADMYAHQMRSLWHTTRFEQGKIWARETGQKRWLPWDTSAMANFDDAVLREVGYRRNPAGRPKDLVTPDSVHKAADKYGELQTMRFNRMKEEGVAGYDTIDPDSLYIKHKWDGVKMSNIATKYDEAFVKKLIKQAILSGKEFDRAHKYKHLGTLTDEYKDRTATHMADAIYHRFTRRPDTVNMARAGWLTKKDTQELQRRAEELLTNPEDIKHLMSATEGKDARLVNELLTQIDMDLNVEIDGVAARHLLDSDLGASMDTEIRRSAGKAAMAKMGFKSQDEFLEFVEKANRWSRKNLGLGKQDLDRINTQNYRLWNLVMGENLELNANSTGANIGRALRKAATLASLNQVGFAQAAETGRLVGALGVKQFIKQIPEFRNMIKRMKNGTFNDPMLNDFETAFTLRLGDNEILNNPTLMTEAGGIGITKAESKTWLAGMDAAMNKGLHVQGYLNGMNVIMKAQHRMHARGFMMNLWEDLQKAEIPKSRMRRYADMGLAPEDLEGIKKEFSKNVEMGDGWFGQKRPVNMNLVKMNPQLREKLALSFWKNQAQTVQRTIGGESAWWMEGTLGKMFSQFRTFPLVAIEKQTIHDLKHLDIESFTTMTAGFGFAALAYTAKTYANSFGLPPKKRKQYLKNRLSPEKIAAGAASWSGQANIMPDAMQTAGEFGFSNPFQWTYQKGQAYRDYGRARGLDLGATGAAGAMLSSAYRFATGMGQVALTEKELRKDIFKDPIRIAPFGNFLVIKALQNMNLE